MTILAGFGHTWTDRLRQLPTNRPVLDELTILDERLQDLLGSIHNLKRRARAGTFPPITKIRNKLYGVDTEELAVWLKGRQMRPDCATGISDNLRKRRKKSGTRSSPRSPSETPES